MRQPGARGGSKAKYEPPVVVPLGELARGNGVCGAGSSVKESCGNGAGANGCSDGGGGF
jgi:hypothetical protein